MPTESRPQRKIVRVMDKYERRDLAEELADRWTRGDDRYTVRQLADWFNARVLKTAMREAGMDPLPNEADNVYDLLTDDEVDAGQRRQTEVRLERQGIDPEELRQDFVSYQSVYTYLTEDRGLESPTDDQLTPAEASQRLQRLRNRSRRVVGETLETLNRHGAIDTQPPEPVVSFLVRCPNCGTRTPVTEFISEGGCEQCLGEDTG